MISENPKSCNLEMLFTIGNIFAVICAFAAVAYGVNLPVGEVEALRVIAETLRKTDWNFSVDPCNWQLGRVTLNPPEDFENAVTCNCSFLNDTVCHVVSIVLKSQNLSGSIPKELVMLPFLQEIDLSRNYLNGTIPSEWGSMKLLSISLAGNRVTGSIPSEVANISTLLNLTLDCNQLSGVIPLEFGNLHHIQNITLTSNNLTGELPESLRNLTTLKDFRISDNNFTGSIPVFIQNWTHIERLEMHASGLSGPIPSTIVSLINLNDLRISDLDGNDSRFPPLNNMTNLKTLVLRSCNIVGELPSFLGQMNFEHLDLSFNKITGPIPDSFINLSQTDYIYLTGNSLDGQVPYWMNSQGKFIDLSYNNLSSESFAPNCQKRKVNLFASSKEHTNGIASCLHVSCKAKVISSLHINCGGEEVANGRYLEDTESGGASEVVQKENWAFSNSGKILDVVADLDTYIMHNSSSIIGSNPQLYTSARVSSLSLTYYLFCLQNGSYTVKLHFAEIMFTDDRTFSSLGRRIFDIYIQGNLVKKDFNIESEAGGVNKAIILNFTANVTDTTLDIRFYWAGKGTTGIPRTGVYGPLISAISVDPDASRSGISVFVGIIVMICIAVRFGVVLILGIIWWKGCLRRRETLENELKGVDLHTMLFTLRQIKAATNNFDPANKIGQGGFGPVYKGLLSDGTAIAVKQLSSTSKQGNREFVTEIGMVSVVQHPNLVKLHGCCIDGNQLFLIYEYLENNSLFRALLGSEEHRLNLDWPTRHKICIGIARGLAYLHEESRLKIVHRDIKATNVLLDKNLNPKISDFGLAKLNDEDSTHLTTRVAGTYGYMAPEYAMRGYLTDKADVYSFGIVLLEVVSGRSITTIKTDDHFYLLDWAISLKESGNFLELVDPKLEMKFNEEEVLTAIKVALQCTNDVVTERPSMSAVVSLLEGVHDSISDSHNVSFKKMNTEEIITLHNVDGKGGLVDTSLTSSSEPGGDLYSINLDSEYWESRNRKYIKL